MVKFSVANIITFNGDIHQMRLIPLIFLIPDLSNTLNILFVRKSMSR